MIPFLDWCLAHWWLLFLRAVCGVLGWARDVVLGLAGAAAGTGARRHERRMKELELRARAAGEGPARALPKPGRCVHRGVKAVVGGGDEVKARLCGTCGVREEDL
jgi:hypothetical protein